MKHLLITYVDPGAIGNHVDPDFKNLVYGDSGDRGYILLNNLQKGSYVFFNTTISDKRYITGYFCVDKILMKNRDDSEILKLESDAKQDEIIIIGSRDKSKVLTRPVLFDRNVIMSLPALKADKNYFDEKFKNNFSELSAINSKTRTHRKLKDFDRDILLKICEHKG